MARNIDAWVKDRTNGGSGGFLKDWKKDGSIYVLLHRLVVPEEVWEHNVPTVVIREDRKTKEIEKRVWGKSYVCHEEKKILTARKRDSDDRRLVSYCACGLCKFTEWVREGVMSGRIGICEPVFKYISDEEKESVTLRAGGLFGAYGFDDLSKEQRDDMKKAGVTPKTGWREKITATAKGCFVILPVDSDGEPKGEVSKYKGAGSLLDHQRECVEKRIESLGSDDGDPFQNPVVFRWKYDDAEQDFGKKYSCNAVEKIKPSKEALALISADPPEYKEDIKPFNQTSMRARFERECLLKDVPWDEIFSGEAVKDKPKKNADRSASKKEEPEEEEESDSAEDVPADEEEMVECDAEVVVNTKGKGKVKRKCGALMPASASTCPTCGFEYEATPADPPAKEEPKKAPPELSKKAASAKALVGEKKTNKEREDDALENLDEVPF